MTGDAPARHPGPPTPPELPHVDGLSGALDRSARVLAEELAADLTAAGDGGPGRAGWLDRPSLLRRLAAALAAEVPATADRLVAAGGGALALGAAVSLETGLPFAALGPGTPPLGVVHPGETVTVVSVAAAAAVEVLPLLAAARAVPHTAAVVVAPEEAAAGGPPGFTRWSAVVRRTAEGYAAAGAGGGPGEVAGPGSLPADEPGGVRDAARGRPEDVQGSPVDGPAGATGGDVRQEQRTERQESAMSANPLAPSGRSGPLGDDPGSVEEAGAIVAQEAARHRPEAVVSWNDTADVLLAHVVARTLGVHRRVVVEDLGRLIVEDVVPGERTVVVTRGTDPAEDLTPLIRAVTGHGGRIVAVCSLTAQGPSSTEAGAGLSTEAAAALAAGAEL